MDGSVLNKEVPYKLTKPVYLNWPITQFAIFKEYVKDFVEG